MLNIYKNIYLILLGISNMQFYCQNLHGIGDIRDTRLRVDFISRTTTQKRRTK